MDYYEYVRRNIYRPAGMKNSDHYDHTRPTSGTGGRLLDLRGRVCGRTRSCWRREDLGGW